MKSNEGEKLEAKLPKGLNTQKKLLLLLFLPKNFVAVFYFFTFFFFFIGKTKDDARLANAETRKMRKT